MIKIDCRKKALNCDCDCKDLGEDVDFLLNALEEETSISSKFAEVTYIYSKNLLDKVNLIANHLGLEFAIQPEVPAIPEKIVLQRVTKEKKKPAKKTVKKVAKKVVKKK